MSLSRLAIEGGKPVRSRPWSIPQRGDDPTRQHLIAALVSENWSNGEQVRAFEQAFAAFLGCEHVALTVNATMALKLALLAWNIGPGDEVVVPALTFPSMAMAVLECGALPVVCDVDPESYCMSAATLEPALSPRTRAILPTHLYCTQCDMPPILDLASRHGLIVIEDCAHVPGTRRHGRYAGTWGQAAIFSFNQKKPLSCGEGGCLATTNAGLYQRVRWLRDFDTPAVGPPTRMQRMGKVSEFQASVLSGQLASLTDRLRITEKRAEMLRERVERLPGVRVLPRLPGTELQTFYNFCLRVSRTTDTKAFRAALSAEIGLAVGTTYKPLDRDPALDCSNDHQFRSHQLRVTGGPCTTAKNAYEAAMRFPSHFLSVDPTAVDDIATAVEKVLPHYTD